MGLIDRNEFSEAVRVARSDGNWGAPANVLSGLAMFDILPALAAVDEPARQRVLQAGRTALVRDAYDRIDFAKDVVSTKTLGSYPLGLPEDQVDDARRYLFALLRPRSSQAKVASFSTMNAAATRAIDEIKSLTQALKTEFAGSIYKQNGAYKFTAPDMGGTDWSSSQVAVPKGTQWVGMYHAHPAVNPNAENFSPQDMAICRGITDGSSVLRPPLVTYLGTPTGRIKKLTPPALLQGADAETYGFLGKQEVLR
jgi:hypothetical protein